MTQRYKMTVSYDGTNYAGWQFQKTHPTIQCELERAILERTGETVRVHSSGRTDAGVHARGQVAHFDLETRIEARYLQPGVLAFLPADVRVEAIEEVDREFHARFSSIGKQYRFRIWNDVVMRAYLRHFRAHVKRPLDLGAMRQAAADLAGTHDFTAYSSNPNRPVETNVRTLRKLEIQGNGPEVLIVAEGNGFLYKMVRSLAGFLIQVGLGEEPASEAAVILESKQRTARVPTAHPQGLYLWQVYYSDKNDDATV